MRSAPFLCVISKRHAAGLRAGRGRGRSRAQKSKPPRVQLSEAEKRLGELQRRIASMHAAVWGRADDGSGKHGGGVEGDGTVPVSVPPWAVMYTRRAGRRI